jgi:OmpA-OmpF porin, OOP family
MDNILFNFYEHFKSRDTFHTLHMSQSLSLLWIITFMVSALQTDLWAQSSKSNQSNQTKTNTSVATKKISSKQTVTTASNEANPQKSIEKNQPKSPNETTAQGTRSIGQEKSLPNDRVAVQKRAASHNGATGLSETLSADTGPQGTFRLAIFFGSFQSDSFLIPGKEDTFSMTYLAFAYTPLETLEVYANTRAISHFNTLNTPNTIQSQGDLNVGIKGSKFWNSIGVGGALDTQFYSGIGGGLNLAATSVNLHALFTVDLLRRKAPIPFRFLLDIQYTFENSEALFDTLPEEPNLIQEWGFQSARYDRLHLHFGFEVPTHYISIFTEYNIGTPFLVEMTRLGRYANIFAFESVPHSINVGLRGFTMEHIALDLSANFGLSDQPTTGVPATPPWMLWTGLTYTLDPRPKVVEREIKITPPKPKVVEVKPIGTLLTLIVQDRVSKKTISNAQVSYLGQGKNPQSTNQNGQVSGYRFPAVSMKIRVQAEGYQSKTVKLKIPKGRDQLKAKLSLKPSPTKALAQVNIQLAPEVIKSLQQKPLELTLYGPESRKGQILDQAYQSKVKPGEYILTLGDENGIKYYNIMVLGEGGVANRTIKVTDLNGANNAPKKLFYKASNKWASYNLKKKRLNTRRAINFKGKSVKLTGASKKVIRALANLVKKEPRITRITIYVYTHSVGTSSKDKRLGRQRGNQVKNILKAEGVDPSRVKVFSYGSSKNKASNFTKRGRIKNQKVRFGIKVKATL